MMRNTTQAYHRAARMLLCRPCGALSTAIAAGSFAAAACSALVDTSGLSGGPADAALEASSPGDAAPDVVDVPDAADAADAADGGGICDASFCDDFDDGPLGARWTSMDIGTSGVLSLATPAVSAPNSLRAVLLDALTDDDAYAFVDKDLGPGKAVRCEFSVFLTTRPTDNNHTDLFRIRASGADVKDYQLWFGVTNIDATFREDVFFPDGGCDCPRQDVGPDSFPDARWVRVTVESNFKTATVRYDGTVVASGSLGGFIPTGRLSVALGVGGYAGHRTDVLFDDFVCTVTP